MRWSWGILLLALTLAACAATPPPAPSGDTSAPGTSAPATATRPATTDGQPAPSAPATDLAPSSAPTLMPGGRLAIRYSGTPGTEFTGIVTGLFDDGAVVPADASGVVLQRPFTQTMGEATVALRVIGTVLSGSGTYRLEILGGHLDASGIFVEDQVLAMDEASGQGEEVRVDYGNVDL